MTESALQQAFQDVENYYRERGIFMPSPRFGKRPALVIVDMAYAWTDPSYAGGSARLDAAVENIQTLLAMCRANSIPIIYTTAFYHPGETDPHLSDAARATNYRAWDARACEIDERLTPQSDELVIRKSSASAFFGTALVSFLIEHKIDTVIVTGCSTSACIRATVNDAISYRFKAIVPRECVQDRAEASHVWNLFDLETKSGVVADVERVIDYVLHLEPAKDS